MSSRTELLRIPPIPSSEWQVDYHFQELFPDLDGALYLPEKPTKTVCVVMHPTVGFLHHYVLEPLAKRGFAAVGVNSRYAWNDTTLLMECVMLDIAAVIRYLRRRGYENVVLLGNSGGSFMASYQRQAEHPSIKCTPAGDPPDLTRVSLEPAAAMIFLNCSQGRARTMTAWTDPCLLDERDPYARDPGLDMFNPENGPPYSKEFVEKYRAAQFARNERITTWARNQIDRRKNDPVKDVGFIFQCTAADLRYLDLGLDPSDREVGCYRGDPYKANLAVTGLARYCTARSWLSQWSVSETNQDTCRDLKFTSFPALVIQGTADMGIYPSDAKAIYDAVPNEKKELHFIKGGKHYFDHQQKELSEALDIMTGWLDRVL
jgi:pimeloyl-ACP methyl ester carboxylesterase